MGTHEKDCFIKSKNKCGKSKSAGSLDESEEIDRRTLQLVDSVCAQFETIVMTGSEKLSQRDVHFGQWCGGVRSRNHWEMTTRCKSKNRDRTKQRRFLLCKVKDFECCRL